MSTLLRQTRSGEFSTPKTVLGFYAAVLVILEAGIVAVLALLAATESLLHLIPWVLGFGGLLLVGLLAIVVAINILSPTKLQLGEVSGKDFLEHQQVMRGDSIAGEYLGPAPTTEPSTLDQSMRLELEPGTKGDQQEESD